MLVLVLLIPVLLLAAALDARWQRIPNWVTFPAIGGAMALHIGLHGFEGLYFSLEGIGMGIALLLGFYALGGMGAGDVKLLGVVGGFLGPTGVLNAFLVTALLGGAYAVALCLARWGLRQGMRNLLDLCKVWLVTRRAGCPPGSPAAEIRLRYGVVIALGTLVSELWAVRLFGL